MKLLTTQLFLLIVLLGLQDVQAQECGNTLFFCTEADSYIELDHPNDSLYLVLGSGTNKDTIHVECIDGLIVFDVRNHYYFSGSYSIVSDTVICRGPYLRSTCSDIVYVDQYIPCQFYDSEFICDPFNDREVLSFCPGDTVDFLIGQEFSFYPEPYLPFLPERLNLQVGTILDYNHDRFSVAWTEPGEFCMQLETKNKADAQQLYSYLPIIVWPDYPVNILKDNTKIQSTKICAGDSLKLNVDYVGSAEPRWKSDDGRIFNSLDLATVFEDPGEYLLTFDLNKYCDCTPPSEVLVTVIPSAAPSISCSRTVCLGEEVTYRADNECDSYIWEVPSEGTITEGGGVGDDYVTVQWNAGVSNSISLSTPDCFGQLCAIPNIETINIINPSVQIDGEDDLCSGSIVQYTAPEYTGTAYTWTTSNHGVIISGQGTNTVEVLWSSPLYTNGLLTVEYENCNIDCKGYAELPVTIRPEFAILIDIDEVCIDNPFHYRTTLGLPMKWLIVNAQQDTIDSFNSASIDYTFTEADDYKIIVIDTTNTTCVNTQSKDLFVKPTLDAPSNVYGPVSILLR